MATWTYAQWLPYNETYVQIKLATFLGDNNKGPSMQLPSYTIDAPEHTNILPTGMKTLKVRVSRFTDAINILAWQGQNGMPNGTSWKPNMDGYVIQWNMEALDAYAPLNRQNFTYILEKVGGDVSPCHAMWQTIPNPSRIYMYPRDNGVEGCYSLTSCKFDANYYYRIYGGVTTYSVACLIDNYWT